MDCVNENQLKLLHKSMILKFYKKLTYHRLSQTDLGSYKKVQDFFFKDPLNKIIHLLKLSFIGLLVYFFPLWLNGALISFKGCSYVVILS